MEDKKKAHIWQLAKYLKHYKKEAVIGPLFKMLEASFELLVPIVMARIIDVGIYRGDNGYIWRMCAILIGLSVLGLASSLTAQYFAAKASLGFAAELRSALYRHINRFSYHELDTIGTETLVTRMTNDVNTVQNGVNMMLRLFLRAPFIVVGAVVMAFLISKKLTLIFLSAIILLSGIIFLIIQRTLPLYSGVQKILDRVVLLLRENYVGARVVRAFSREEDEIEEFQKTAQELKNLQLRAGRLSSLMNPGTYLCVNAAILLILYNGSREVSMGNITQGEIIALINYMMQILLALVALANLIVIATKAVASGIRVQEVLNLSCEMTENEENVPKEEGRPRVSFRQVTFSYDRAKAPSLQDITFDAWPGETIGVIGGTGSGKSTLVSLIPRFYDHQMGKVEVDGVPVDQYPFHQLREKIGFVPQKAVLFSGTIRSNLLFGNEDASEEDMQHALSVSQAREIVEKKPEGLDTKITSGGKNLSGGQRQRLTIARALVRKPEIMILDDSGSALDYATDAALRRAIQDNTRGTTVFIVSQRVASVMNADKILVLDEGRLVGAGSHRELLRSCGIYKEICLAQMTKEEVEQYE